MLQMCVHILMPLMQQLYIFLFNNEKLLHGDAKLQVR